MEQILQQFSRHRWPLLWAVVAILSSYLYTVYTPFYQPRLPETRVWLTGQVEKIQSYETRTRILLRHVRLYGIQTPVPRLDHVRLSMSSKRWERLEVSLGGGVAAQAMLFPVPVADFPGDYDATRQAAFWGLEATGYVMGEVSATEIPYQPTFWDRLNDVRQTLAERISSQSSSLAAAFLTGRRDAVDRDIQDHFRASGLAHLLAISGLHLGMVAGMVFFALRYFLAWFPTVALRYSTKKAAALVAIAVAGGYMLLAGATIPTVRAFIMVGCLLLSVLLERQHIALRLWALAVVMVLLLWPESVVTASFQMSFLATLVLVLWGGGAYGGRRNSTRLGYIKGIFVTSLLAGLATMPLAAAHFGSVSFSGFLLNMAAIPVMGFWILPSGLVALLVMPMGLEAWPLWLMQQGVVVLESLAAWGSVGSLGQFLGGWRVPSAAWPVLALVSCMGVAGVLFNRKILVGGSVLLAAAVCAWWPVGAPADVVLLDQGQTVLLCDNNASCGVVRALDGDRTWQRFLKVHHLTQRAFLPRCDGESCGYRLGEKTLVVTEVPSEEDCRHADGVIALYPRVDCPVLSVTKGMAYGFIHLQ